jgi:xanthine/CO dehydrogenase XdhC/CoxF family maturation factor
MDVLLTRVNAADGWQPLDAMARHFSAGTDLRVAFVVASNTPDVPLGTRIPIDGALVDATPNSTVLHAGHEVFVAALVPAARVLLLGGGPDARPVAELASFLGWRVTVVDHRSTYLVPSRFPPGTRLVEARAAGVAAAVELDAHAAAIVMSHHLDSDLDYLRALSSSAVGYVGLLGPAARREKLLGDLGAAADALRPRLRAPVGLDIGGRAPESIALSIVGEVHAFLEGRAGRPFSETAAPNARDTGAPDAGEAGAARAR